MPRLSRTQILRNSKAAIIKIIRESKVDVYTIRHIEELLEQLKELNLASKITTKVDLLSFLRENNILKETCLVFPNNKKVVRYTFSEREITPFKIALTVNSNSYLTHYSSMFIHELTDNVPKIIYTNLEQTPKYTDDEDRILEQENIDMAFSKPMRTTNQVAQIQDTIYSVYFLNGKNVDRAGVTTINYNNTKINVTTLERTLIDITVRPAYSGGVNEVLNAYIEAKERVSTNKLVATLKKMDYIYPYHQAIGFYMERAGYSERALSLLKKIPIKYNFYLTYEISKKTFSDRWRLFFPKELD